MMGDLLEAVVAAARRSAEERERAAGWSEIDRALAAGRRGPHLFREAVSAPGIRVIAECKRRSPSRGILRSHYEPARIASGYQAAGAAAISVLTEPAFFDGSLDHLREVRGAVTIPVLRKDFVVTDYQIAEAAAAGADAVLLIVAALSGPALTALMRAADTYGVDALVEVHDREELARAVDAGADLIGVNSRNLRTLEVTPATLDELAASIPDDVTAVAESGLKTPADVARLRTVGYDAFLIGERFMIESDPGAALAQLLKATTVPA